MQELFPKMRTGKYPDLPDELTSMGIPANAGTLRMQLEMAGQMDFLDFPSHQGIVDGTLPLSIGGGSGQARTYMSILKKAYLDEVFVTVWPKILEEVFAKRNVHVLD